MSNIYYECLGEAVDAALHLCPEGFVVDDEDLAQTWEGMGYETSQSKSYTLKSLTHGKRNRFLQVNVYRMPSGRYELTAYVGK